MLALVGCTSQAAQGVRFSGEPQPVGLGELGACNESGKASTVDPRAPMVVLVHGCNYSQGRFAALSEVFALHDQQTLCFRYNDRRRIGDVALELNRALGKLAAQLERSELTVLGHSQGGLVARAAVALAHQQPLNTRRGPLRLSLVTVSAPFSGIRAASDCGALWLHITSLGTTLAVCRVVAGAKWRDIHARSQLVQSPGRLATQVDAHLEIRTDERDTCRTIGPDGLCSHSDYVFSLGEQHNERVDADPRVTTDLVAAGHVEIVGDKAMPPLKLLVALQRHGVLNPTPAPKQAALQALLTRLF